MIKVNCQWNDQGTWCKNKKVKRSLFGLGARYCIAYGILNHKQCQLKKPWPKPLAPPPPPKPKMNTVKSSAVDKINRITQEEIAYLWKKELKDLTNNVHMQQEKTIVYSNYDIISDLSVKDLTSKVNTFIKHGYILFNGPFFAQDQYHQAIIRKANKEKL